MQPVQNGQPTQQNPPAITDAAPPSDRGLAQYQPPPQEVIVDQWDHGQKYLRSSFPAETEEGLCAISRLTVKADSDIEGVYGKDIAIVGYVYHPVLLPNKETGELQWKGRLAMMLEDGSTVDTCSESAIGALAAVCKSRGASPWEKPIWMHVESRRGRTSGHDYAVMWMIPKPSHTKKK